MPGGALELQAPPDPAKPISSGLAQRFLPWGMVLGPVGMVAVMGVDNPTSWLFAGVFALSSLGLLAGSLGRGGTQGAQTDENRRDYLRYLAQVRARIRGIASAQRAALEWLHPHPAELIAVLSGDRLWERRTTDPDFGQVRVGRGRQRLATRLVAPRTGPVDELEPVCAWGLRRLIRVNQTVPDLPIAVALLSMRRVCLRPADAPVASGTTGHQLEPLRATARAMLAQYTVWHSPAEARLAVITSTASAHHWDWVKWLPHVQHPSLTDDVGALRLVTGDPAEVTEWLVAPGMAGSGAAGPPRLLVLVDGVDVRRAGAHWLDRAEITVLRLADSGSAAGERGELTLRVDQNRLGVCDDRTVGGEPNWIGRPDLLSHCEAEVLARRMARFRPPRGAEPGTGRPPGGTVDLPELLGMDGPASIAAARARWSGSPRDTLRVPIGVGESGEPVVLDLKESGQGGFGPHGLCIGATGSGKARPILWHTYPVTDNLARRGAVYVRISRDKVGSGLGVARQQADCEALAERMGLSVVEVFIDNDLSAFSGKVRPGYRALLDAIEGGRIDVVLTWHGDRLHRSMTELEHWIEVCEPGGVEVHTVKAGPVDLATPSGRLMARQFGAMARYESEHRGERVAAKFEELARAGKFLGGVRPFGYTKDGMHLEPVEAALIAEGTAQILRGGSLRSVAAMFRESGTRTTKSDKEWTTPAVRDILMRARNAALLEHRGQIVGPASWPAIVGEDEWRAVCTALTSPGRRTSPGNQPRWLGSMIYRCGICGDVLIVGTSGQQRNPSYRCQAARERGVPRHVTRVAPALDAYVSDLIIARLERADAAALFRRAHMPAARLDELRRDLAEVTNQRDELAARFGRGEVTMSMLDAANHGLDARQRELEAQLAGAQLRSVSAELAEADDVAAHWESLDLAQKRAVLNELLIVTVHPAPRGRRPNGDYFDMDSIGVQWRDAVGEG